MNVPLRFSTSNGLLLAALLLLAGGCLPHSCAGPGPATALLPADSLSRGVARSVPIDTLRRAWRVEAAGGVPLRFPRTALFLPGHDSSATSNAALVVSDAERDALLFFSGRGQFVRAVTSDQFAAPYLIGQRADTLLVLSPRERLVHRVAGGHVTRATTLDLPPPREAPLLWAHAAAGEVFAKTVDAEGRAAITRHGPAGQRVAQHMLAGPRWYHTGPLRVWRDSLASLSGYRPVVYRLPLSLSVPADTAHAVRLAGFDSPMLARTRSYAEGDARQPPLLLPDAATTADGHLFALNLRAGRLRIDAFGPDGRLAGRLAAPDSARTQDVYPRALAARRHPGGGYALAVALTAPQPAVALYRWQPGAPPSPASEPSAAARAD